MSIDNNKNYNIDTSKFFLQESQSPSVEKTKVKSKLDSKVEGIFVGAFSDPVEPQSSYQDAIREGFLNLINAKKYKLDLTPSDKRAVFTFTQGRLLAAKDKMVPELKKIEERFNGFCELICNVVLCDDLLGKPHEEILKSPEKHNHLRQRVNINRLNEKNVIKSHLLSVYSIKEKIVAFFFSVYPQNIYSTRDQWRLVTKSNDKFEVDRTMLEKGLSKIEEGQILKVEVFNKGIFSLNGHSVLIKKDKDNKFIFFDPNRGEFRDLTLAELRDKLNVVLAEHKGTDIFFIRGEDFIKRLQDKKLIDEKVTVSARAALPPH